MGRVVRKISDRKLRLLLMRRGRTVERVNSIIARLHKAGAYHKRRGFRLLDADNQLTSNHLLEEAIEFQAELFFGNRKHQIEEASDVLTVFLHTLYVSGISLKEVVKIATIKLKSNFTTNHDEIQTITPGKLRRNRRSGTN